VSEVRPDLLVIALDDPSKRPRLCDTLLRDCPKLRIIAVASQENAASFIGHRSTFTRARLKRQSKDSQCSTKCRNHGCRGTGIEIERLGLQRGVSEYEQAMKPIRVLVANRPRLMRELMVATISEQPDIELSVKCRTTRTGECSGENAA